MYLQIHTNFGHYLELTNAGTFSLPKSLGQWFSSAATDIFMPLF
jgi:hypothetical protein